VTILTRWCTPSSPPQASFENLLACVVQQKREMAPHLVLSAIDEALVGTYIEEKASHASA
jgi:hypothetical protein